MNDVAQFIEQNRQTGSTTALINLISKEGGYLIVGKQQTADLLIRQHPLLKKQIFSLINLRPGMTKMKVFFDTDAVAYISNKSFQLPAIKIETEILTKQINVKLTEDDVKSIDDINLSFFEGEATNSMIGRILLRKGIQFYQKLKKKL